jgi:hypothetical protein
MVPVTLENIRQGMTWHVDGCKVPGCVRHYSIHEGYFDVIDGRPMPEKLNRQLCPEDETAMYLESRDPRTREEVWRCAQTGCKHVKKISPAA